MMKAITIFTHKGGCGKTSCVGAIAAQLTMNDKKVLMVDTDGQGNLSSQFCKSINKELADVLYGDCKVSDAINKTEYKDLFILPTKRIINNGRLDRWIKNQASEEENRNIIKKLVKVLEQFNFDFVIFDNPPAYTDMTKKILLACDEVIPVLKLDSFSESGLKDFFILLDRLKDGDEKPFLKKLILNCRDKRIKLHNDFIKDMEKIELQKYIIPNDTAFTKSQYACSAVQSFDLKKETAEELDRLAKDLISEE